MNNMNWSIGLEVTLSVLGFTDINTPTDRRDDLLGQPAHRDGRRHLVVDRLPGAARRDPAFIGLFLLAVSMNEYIDPRSRLGRRRRHDRATAMTAPAARGLRTCAPTTAPRQFGVRREVRAVDDVDLRVEARRDLRPGRRIELRQDHADQDHRRRDPAAARGASAARSTFNFDGRNGRHVPRRAATSCAAIRWRHLSYIMQGSMNVLNPVRRVRQAFVDFAFRHIGQPMPAVPGHRARAPARACTSSPTCSTPIRTSCRAACASA